MDPPSLAEVRTPVAPTFRYAEPAQILRAHQRDQGQVQRLHDLLSDVLRGTLGSRWILPYQEWIEAAAKLAYFGLTFGLGSQTVGEEYTDILPFANRRGRFPTRRRRLAAILALVFSPILLRYLATFLRSLPSPAPPTTSNSSTASPSSSEPRKRSLRAILLALLDSRWTKALPELWFVWFLVRKRNIDWGKSLVGMRYISAIPPGTNPHSARPTYEPVGLLLLLPIVTRLLSPLRSSSSSTSPGNSSEKINTSKPTKYRLDGRPIHPELIGEASSPEEDSLDKAEDPSANKTILRKEDLELKDRQCPLCLSPRGVAKESGGTVVTECGHIFCMSCIEEWATEKMECPLCRQELRMERLIPAYNL